MEIFAEMNIYLVGLIAGLFTWGMTAAGSGLVFFIKGYKQIYLDAMLGFSAGVMIAASFFSLILPALDFAEAQNSSISPIYMVVFGFMSGVLILMWMDKKIPHLHWFTEKTEGPKSSLHRSILLVSAITMHNIPEGLAIGVTLGGYAVTGDPALLAAGVALAIGIGIQNFPEGSAVSFPLYREGFSKKKSFMYGQASAVVEPVSVLLGIFLVGFFSNIIAFLLAFAAGAMMFVVVEELVPESQANNNTDIVTLFTMIGLCVMMLLDVLLG